MATEICFMTALELAARIRRKELSAREVLEAHLRQIEKTNPKVNAIVTLDADGAKKRAALADEDAAKGKFHGVLHGLPTAHKDLHETKGMRTTYGSPIFRAFIPDFNSMIVERMQQAGAITIGKTNTPEFGAGSQTFNRVFGATKNPYDLSKTAGGSSGGAAAALACGMLPIADGSDMGGSLRNPAAFCSVVGFRVSPGRVARVPTIAAWSPLAVTGPMARNVADTAFFLSAIAGPDARDPLSIHESGDVFRKPLDRNLKGARVAWCSNFAGLPFDSRIKTGFDASRKVLEQIGCLVEEARPDFSDADEIFKTLRALAFFQQHGAKLPQYRAELKDTIIEEIERGAKLTALQIADAETKRSRLFARIGQFLQSYEFMILPVTQVPPFSVDQPYVTEIEGTRFASYIDWMRSCYYITLTGLPALSVPAGFTTDGLPVGLQIVGRHTADWSVLQLGAAFERAAKVKPAFPKIAL